MARFIERWSQMTVHPFFGSAALIDIYERLGEEDQAYFRQSREERYATTLEEVVSGAVGGLDAFRASLTPLRNMLAYQPWIGGEGPLFADYIVFGAFQWMRIMSPQPFLAADDPVAEWFHRCLDLHGGIARKVAAAA